ncbi:hypothetical protein F4775DRAFT_545657 [Biscogniauxia sp. FL1348]|nr:hypothetical protein F4775DRAFT_545657 [Biscogniauxia sp. FL1348]
MYLPKVIHLLLFCLLFFPFSLPLIFLVPFSSFFSQDLRWKRGRFGRLLLTQFREPADPGQSQIINTSCGYRSTNLSPLSHSHSHPLWPRRHS